MQTRQTHRVNDRNEPSGVALNLLASALTILTAIALLGTAAVLGDTSATVMAPERHDRVMHAFYSAVNEALRSGDATALGRVVAPNLVFHAPSPRFAPNRAGLEGLLTSIHTSSPTFQLQVEDIVSDGERAVARVNGGSEPAGGFLGLALIAAPSPWGHFDSFRIVNRQIVELWLSAPAPVQFEPAAEVRLNLETPPQAISLARFSASSGEQQEWGPFSGPRVLYVKAGTVTVDRIQAEPPRDVSLKRSGQAQPTRAATRASEVGTAGEALSFPPGVRFMVRHDPTDTGATVFTVALPEFHYVGAQQPQAPIATGKNSDNQADLQLTETVPDSAPWLDSMAGVTVAIGRAMLPAGATIAFDEADGYTFIGVDTGALVLTSTREVMSLEQLNAADMGMIKPGEPFALHNPGDEIATAFMVTVLKPSL